jgi:phytoene dehydrogenase-like protein
MSSSQDIDKVYDYLVIGAGYGGLAAASLLAKKGYSVCLLEAHGKPGGCASYFKREGVIFSAGATTISGFGDYKPISKLCKILDIEIEARSLLERLDIGMVVNIDNRELLRHSEQTAWKKEAQSFFDLSQKQMRFFDLSQKIDNLAWRVLDANQNLLPTSFRDFGELMRPSKLFINLQALILLPGLFLSMKFLLARFNLDSNKLFSRFMDEQLLITTQNHMSKSPYLSGVMGFSYPGEVFYPRGSIASLAKLIEKRFCELGGEIYYRQKVTNVDFDNQTYIIQTDSEIAKKSITNRRIFSAKNIISNIPIWNFKAIAPKNIANKLSKYSKLPENIWSAFMVYLLLRSSKPLLSKSAYYQIHTDSEIPYSGSKSFFVSTNIESDAHDSTYAVTISTHVRSSEWLGLSEDEYLRRKDLTRKFILDELFTKYPEFYSAEIIHISDASPKTYQHYTSRMNGYVGGIPHSIDNPLIFSCPNKLTKSCYLGGDTVFPGQGIAAVVYSALSLDSKIN